LLDAESYRARGSTARTLQVHVTGNRANRTVDDKVNAICSVTYSGCRGHRRFTNIQIEARLRTLTGIATALIGLRRHVLSFRRRIPGLTGVGDGDGIRFRQRAGGLSLQTRARRETAPLAMANELRDKPETSARRACS